MEFIPGVISPTSLNKDETLCFAFVGSYVIVEPTERGPRILSLAEIEALDIAQEQSHYLGQLRNQHCFTMRISTESVPEPLQLKPLRSLIIDSDPELFTLAGMARQIHEWDHNHRFCGRCGTATVYHHRDRARACNHCELVQYPRISPCIIVLITRGEHILLARSPRFPPGIYSTLAGFVEVGETLEMALHREIKEEVGIKVANERYIESQSWPFPHSLMMGFEAEYESGEIVLEDDEIEAAAWWSVNDLPQLPPKGSISRHLIDRYVTAYQRHCEPS